MKNQQYHSKSEFTKAQNLLRILISIARNPNRTPPEIAGELEIHKATYYRYFTELTQIIPLSYNSYRRRYEFEKILKSFYEVTDYTMECSDICGQHFNSVTEHSEFVKKGGCSRLLDALTKSVYPK